MWLCTSCCIDWQSGDNLRIYIFSSFVVRLLSNWPTSYWVLIARSLWCLTTCMSRNVGCDLNDLNGPWPPDILSNHAYNWVWVHNVNGWTLIADHMFVTKSNALQPMRLTVQLSAKLVYIVHNTLQSNIVCAVTDHVYCCSHYGASLGTLLSWGDGDYSGLKPNTAPVLDRHGEGAWKTVSRSQNTFNRWRMPRERKDVHIFQSSQPGEHWYSTILKVLYKKVYSTSRCANADVKGRSSS